MTVQGALNSLGSKQYRIEFFSNKSCDPSGQGGGEKFVGFTNATTNAPGGAAFSINVPSADIVGPVMTATASDPDGNTSEFSQCCTATVALPRLSINDITIPEGSGGPDTTHASFTVTLSEPSAQPVTVVYASQEDTATSAVGYNWIDATTLTFAPGETSKTFDVLLNEDSLDEGDMETFRVSLSKPAGATLGQPSTAEVRITDDASEPAENASDDGQFFVRQQYYDFLNREPSLSGLAFWTNELLACGADKQCLDRKRQHVSAAFFLSIEFQGTGYFAYS